MNKKMIGIIATVVAVIAVIIIVCLCGEKQEEVKMALQIDFLERTVSVTMNYPKSKGVTVEDTEWEYSKIFKSEKNNYTLDVMLHEDTTYSANKEYAAEEEGYEEIKIGNYSGYIEKSSYDIEGKILLEELPDEGGEIYLSFELESMNNDDVDPKSLFDLDEVQKILKSIKYDKGENTKEQTKQAIEEKEEVEKTANYGEFKDKSRTEGTSDKDGLIFIPSYESPDPENLRPEQRNDNVGVDNYLWYTAENREYTDSSIEVRVFPKNGTYSSMEEYIKEKGDMYHWSKTTIAGKEYDTFEFGSNSSKPAKFSDYYSGAFMVGNKVVEFSYNMYEEIPNQELGEQFFKKIIDSIQYSKEFTK